MTVSTTRPFDLSTGLELELLLPEQMSRLALCAELADWAEARMEIFAFPSKVPVPELPSGQYSPEESADLVIELMESIAAHHQAMIQSVAEDGRHFYLLHRAARLVGEDGRTVLSIVHDNTIAGGERVAEVVTAPFFRERLGWVRELIEILRGVPGCVVPSSGALHVHVDGRPFFDGRVLSRLIDSFEAFESALRALLATPATFRAAGPLPSGLGPAVRTELSADVRSVLARFVGDRSCGLNLYNLIGEDPEKITVELKLAGGTVDAQRVIAVRELIVAWARWCIEEAGALPAGRDAEAFLELIALAEEHRRALRGP